MNAFKIFLLYESAHSFSNQKKNYIFVANKHIAYTYSLHIYIYTHIYTYICIKVIKTI